MMTMKINYQKAEFLLSVANISQLPPDEGAEVAIVGRSNSGKSSILNQITQNKRLARVSKTPGRTQHINLFALSEKFRLADLPGYGFANVPLEVKEKWQRLLDSYLSTRHCLHGLILVMDIRHPLKEIDNQLLQWSNQADIPVHILLNKGDKLTRNAIKSTERKVMDAINIYQNPISVQVFSALTGDGAKELRKKLDEWFFNDRQ
jgi:GTP-binding protein